MIEVDPDLSGDGWMIVHVGLAGRNVVGPRLRKGALSEPACAVRRLTRKQADAGAKAWADFLRQQSSGIPDRKPKRRW